MATAKTTKETKVVKETAKVVEEKQVEEKVVETKPVVKRVEPLDPSTPIELFNNTYGTLLCKDDKLSIYIDLSEFGTSEELNFGELKRIVHHGSHSNIIKKGWLYIANEDAIKELRLEKLYQDLVHPLELDELFDNKDIERIEYLMKNAPIGEKEAIIMKTKEKIHNGTLDSIKIEQVVSEQGKIKLR